MANSGASASARETVTLLPTRAIPAIPGTRSRNAVEPAVAAEAVVAEAVGAVTVVRAVPEPDSVVEAGGVCMAFSVSAQWPHEQVQ
ncbi:hypothetical protein GCM10010425_12780 [Streptomyces spororaveus]|uniref:Uncharacterized protein n=1 Tax=Streptomyces spororaveus TaxID=284039 RepID=A0ABQ3T4Y9_9ACTN|nr:hypothetical protein Sspor_09900 [Streptomyces spororaveus]